MFVAGQLTEMDAIIYLIAENNESLMWQDILIKITAETIRR
jgi:hypothetical protein